MTARRDRETPPPSPASRAIERVLNALALELPPTVHADVIAKVRDALDAARAETWDEAIEAAAKAVCERCADPEGRAFGRPCACCVGPTEITLWHESLTRPGHYCVYCDAWPLRALKHAAGKEDHGVETVSGTGCVLGECCPRGYAAAWGDGKTFHVHLPRTE
jgi:hypothetical protein